MSRYRSPLPQLDGGLFLTDGGIETTLIFQEGRALPDFAAFPLLGDPDGEGALLAYYRRYLEIAQRLGTGIILESATWRANADWGARLGYSSESLREMNRLGVALLYRLRDEARHADLPIVISGCIGPRGDGYVADRVMSEPEAEEYHQAQLDAFASAGAEMACALTMNYVEEAVGVARAAARTRLPVALSFTVETDGKLPTGESLGEAIERVDRSTGGYPSYYMINCAHPSHFEHLLDAGEPWTKRLRGLRANASAKSHAELNDASELDDGDPKEFGAACARLRQRHPQLSVLGGCCGTDHRHIEEVALACGAHSQPTVR